MEKEIELMKAIIHNKILLMVILSKLGMEDNEIDELNQTIYNGMDKFINEYINGGKDEEESRN